MKLNKSCLGYRDTTALQIQDESESVRLKADRRQALRAFSPAQGSKEGADHDALTIHSSSSAFTPHSDYSFGTPSDGTIDLLPSSDLLDFDRMEIILDEFEFWNQDVVNSSTYQKDDSLPMIMTPSAVDVATTYFYNQFASAPGHWMFLKQLAQQDEIGPLVSLAIRACGMAALNNSQATINVLDYARAFYADALSELNAALRDPKKCRTDDSLVAVSMLGYYEVRTCLRFCKSFGWLRKADFKIIRTSLVTAANLCHRGRLTFKELCSCSSYEASLSSKEILGECCFGKSGHKQ